MTDIASGGSVVDTWPTAASEAGISTRARYYPNQEVQAELNDETRRLFSSDSLREKINIEGATMEACQVDNEGGVTVERDIRDIQRLRDFLQYERDTSQNRRSESMYSSVTPYLTSTMFLLFQQDSRSQLELSYESFKLLLSHINAFPELFEVFKAFGKRNRGTEDEGWSAYYSRLKPRSDQMRNPPCILEEKAVTGVSPDVLSGQPQIPIHYNLEMSYLFKHVEKVSHRGDGGFPWTVRKTGFYMKYSTLTMESYSVVIAPSEKLQSQIATNFLPKRPTAMEYPTHWVNFHLLSLGSLSTTNWRAYINHVSAEIENIHAKFQCSNIRGRPIAKHLPDDLENPGLGIVEVNFEDLQTLHAYTDNAFHALHALSQNCDVLKAIAQECERLQALEGFQADTERYSQLLDMLESRSREHRFCKRNLESLCQRAERISHMINSAIALRDSSTMTELSKQAKEEAEKAMEETKAMKILTYTAVIYLPASFTAAFLGMDYIKVNKTKDQGFSVQLTSELALYVAITIPIMFLTFLFIWAWGRWPKRSKFADQGSQHTDPDLNMKRSGSSRTITHWLKNPKSTGLS